MSTIVRRAGGSGGWVVGLVAVTVVVVAPVLVILSSVLSPSTAVWSQLLETGQLRRMALDTAGLLVLVATGTLVLGAGLAWLTFAYTFPGSRLLGWLLVLPLAMPGYILGFVTLSLFGFTGPIQGALRSAFGSDVPVPELRSVGGAAIVFVLTLYPYVYLLARAALREQAATGYQVARAFGHGPLAAARRVVLPLARPSLAAGVTLVMMETLTDFATVQYFNVRTLTVGVYDIWKGMFDRQAASEVAALVLLVALLILGAERLLRGRRRYDQPGTGQPLEPTRLTGWSAIAATGVCATVLLFAFVAPAGQLLVWAIGDGLGGPGVDGRFASFTLNSAGLAVAAAILAVGVAALVVNAARFASSRTADTAAQLTTVGYALPGPVVAIGVLVLLAGLDAVLRGVGIDLPGVVVTGSILGLVYAYAVRFLALGVNSVGASLQKVPRDLTDSARVLGAGSGRVLRRIHLPLTSSGLLVGLLLIVVEALKELPIVLLLRPFGFDTLSVWVWQLASDSRWSAAALPALAIIAVSLIPVALLFRRLVPDQGTEDPAAQGAAADDLRVFA
ncbi:ABC transporter permease [Euzebya tangerina]|uniref:ABC transporter permease n=1 Tax=Euzebya tangerina TaxID=591198 RepID=UPI000E314A46|nr:iron ABC transporter permease [Euzebya tangerina]